MPDPVDQQRDNGKVAQRPPQTNVMKYPPKFIIERSYERFQDEVKVWDKITSINTDASGSLLVLSLPDSGKYCDLKGKVMNAVEYDAADGVTKILSFLQENIEADALTDLCEVRPDCP